MIKKQWLVYVFVFVLFFFAFYKRSVFAIEDHVSFFRWSSCVRDMVEGTLYKAGWCAFPPVVYMVFSFMLFTGNSYGFFMGLFRVILYMILFLITISMSRYKGSVKIDRLLWHAFVFVLLNSVFILTGQDTAESLVSSIFLLCGFHALHFHSMYILTGVLFALSLLTSYLSGIVISIILLYLVLCKKKDLFKLGLLLVTMLFIYLFFIRLFPNMMLYTRAAQLQFRPMALFILPSITLAYGLQSIIFIMILLFILSVFCKERTNIFVFVTSLSFTAFAILVPMLINVDISPNPVTPVFVINRYFQIMFPFLFIVIINRYDKTKLIMDFLLILLLLVFVYDRLFVIGFIVGNIELERLKNDINHPMSFLHLEDKYIFCDDAPFLFDVLYRTNSRFSLSKHYVQYHDGAWSPRIFELDGIGTRNVLTYKLEHARTENKLNYIIQSPWRGKALLFFTNVTDDMCSVILPSLIHHCKTCTKKIAIYFTNETECYQFNKTIRQYYTELLPELCQTNTNAAKIVHAILTENMNSTYNCSYPINFTR